MWLKTVDRWTQNNKIWSLRVPIVCPIQVDTFHFFAYIYGRCNFTQQSEKPELKLDRQCIKLIE